MVFKKNIKNTPIFIDGFYQKYDIAGKPWLSINIKIVSKTQDKKTFFRMYMIYKNINNIGFITHYNFGIITLYNTMNLSQTQTVEQYLTELIVLIESTTQEVYNKPLPKFTGLLIQIIKSNKNIEEVLLEVYED